MTSIAALSAAALLAGLSAPPLGAVPTVSGDVTWEARQVVFHGETGKYDLSGGAVVRRGGVVLRARTATVDPDTGEVWASGDVLLMDATRVIHADGMHAVMNGPFEATQVTAFFKDQPFDPVHVATLAEARRGRSRLTFLADRVEGEDEDHLRLYQAHFTLCDCGDGKAPTWELTSRKATVDGDRMALSWPVFRVTPRFLFVQRPVPVLILPWLSLPLTDRQSGLLFPEVGTRGATGWYVGLPAYRTLGRSADLTATPEYFFGPSSPHRVGGAVKGAGARLDLRWAPAERAEGQVLWHVVQDQDQEQPGGAGASGLRLSVEGIHRQDLGPSTRLVSHLSLSQDPYMFRDLGGAGLPNDAYYSRSDVLVSRRWQDWVVEGGAMYLEPLSVAQSGLVRRPRRFGWFGVAAPTLQRWPSIDAALLPVQLGPVQVEGRAGVARYAPLIGREGEILPTDPATRDTNHPFTGATVLGTSPRVTVAALPREAVTRADGRLQLSAPMLLGEAISVEPFVRGAALEYLFDAERGPATAAWAVAGLSTSAELSRRYGEVEHRIVPRLELLAGTNTWRVHPGNPFPALDLWDRVESERAGNLEIEGENRRLPVVQKLSAAPNGGYSQLRATLDNRLDAGPYGQVLLQLGQDLDLRGGEPAETLVSLSGSKGPFSGNATARFLAFGGRPPLPVTWKRWWTDEFTQLQAGASLHDARGDELRASFGATGAGAVGAQGAGIDALFDLRPSSADPSASINLGARGKLGGASLDYAIQLAGRDMPPNSTQCRSGKTRTLQAGGVAQQTAILTWDSPCHCFVARVNASFDACGEPSLGFSVDLSKMLQGAARNAR